MSQSQLEAVYPYALPEGSHPLAGLLVHPLGLQLEPELIQDLAMFLFDMLGCKFHDVEPTTREYVFDWESPRVVDEWVPGGDKASVWSPELPPGITIDPRNGHMTGTLPEGVWKFTVHIGPQIKYDARGGTGSPHEQGQWIGMLEQREEASVVDHVDSLTDDEKDALLKRLLEEQAAKRDETHKEG